MVGREPGEPGGIRSLHGLLTEHGEAIEADLAEYYHVDLADLFRGRLSWRRLGVLIRGLPVESRLTAALPQVESDDEGPAARWTHTEYLMADLYDLLMAVNSEKQADPYPRPRRRVVHRRSSPERVAQLRRATGREVPDVR